MSILKINNNFSKSHLNTVQKQFSRNDNARGFGAFGESNILNEHALFVDKLGDEDMINITSQSPNKRLSSVVKKSQKALFLTIPVSHSILSGVFANGMLSSKLRTSALTGAVWIGSLVAVSAVLGVKKFLNSRSEFFDDFNKKHPLLSTGVDLAATYSGFKGLVSVTKNSKIFVEKHFSSFIKDFKNNVKMPIKNVLNNSIVNKKIVMNGEKFLAKRPYLNSALKVATALFVPLTTVSVLARFSNELSARDKQVETNYLALKTLNNILSEDLK